MDSDKTPYRATFTVGTNLDPALIDVIDRYNADGSFKSIFGKLKSDFFGGGRSSMGLAHVSKDQLKAHIDAAHAKKLGFNYLMNPACLGNKEVDPDDHREMLRCIDEVVEMGVDGITLNSPLLCSILKRRHPKVEIVIGLYAAVYTPKHLVEWKELGAQVFTLSTFLNRDFERLERMLTVARQLGVGVRLIANNLCVPDGACGFYHAAELSHSSQSKEKGADFVLDYSLIHCTTSKITNPEKLIASEWIRPEDIVHYEELCRKVDFRGLGIKLVDRVKSTNAIERIVKAYVERSYEGNLLDILTYIGEQAVNSTEKQGFEWTKKYGFNPMKMVKLDRFFSPPKIFIDNKKLDGLIDRFVKGHSCSRQVCASLGASAKDIPGSCTYCKHWAEEAISFDDANVRPWLANAAEVIDSVRTGTMFGAKPATRAEKRP
jgi:collagenase-like PrtC family protease